MMRLECFSVVVVLLAAAAWGGEQLSRRPITYILDYGPDHVRNPEYIEFIKAAPPDVLHLGKDVVFTHNWGPIRALGGENQAYGKGDYIKRLTPDEVEQRIRDLTDLTKNLHEAGVEKVMPYICGMTIGGDEKTRKGFWEFYDHWDEYKKFDLGPRPQLDPIDWMQRTPDGGLQRFYKYSGPFYPPYEPNQRDAACRNNPCWVQWEDKVAEWAAKVGCDGVFVDNAASQRCYCKYCQEAFKKYIAKKYSKGELREFFGNEVKLATKEDGGLPWVETQRFWLETVRRHLAMIAARRHVKKFYVFPNGGEHRPQNIKLAFRDTDYVMFERSVGQYGTHPGLAMFNVVEDIYLKVINDNVFEYKYVEALRRNVRPMVLTRAGWPRTQKWLRMNPDVAALGMAESAAFGNGGGFLLRAKSEFSEMLNRYRKFFERNADLYTGNRCWGVVGVAVFGEQNLYGNRRHIAQVKDATEQLLDAHIPFGYITEEHFMPEVLAEYELVLVPCIEYMSRSQAEVLLGFVENGGRALVAGECGKFDEKCVAREPSLVAKMLPPMPEDEGQAASRRFGRGKVGLVRRVLSSSGWLAGRVEELIGRNPSVLDGSGDLRAVRVNVFTRGDDAREYFVHLVNYNVPLGVDAPPPREFDDLRLSLQLPGLPGRVKAVCVCPESEKATKLEVKRKGDGISFVVPHLRIYKIVKLGLPR